MLPLSACILHFLFIFHRSHMPLILTDLWYFKFGWWVVWLWKCNVLLQRPWSYKALYVQTVPHTAFLLALMTHMEFIYIDLDTNHCPVQLNNTCGMCHYKTYEILWQECNFIKYTHLSLRMQLYLYDMIRCECINPRERI